MKTKNQLTAWVLVLPIVLGMTVFFIAPFVISIYYAFSNGIQGFLDVLSNKAFMLALKNTVLFILIGVTLNLCIAFILAYIIKSYLNSNVIITSILTFPLTVPIATILMVMQILFSRNGTANSFLVKMGAVKIDWLQSEYAFAILIGLFLWKSVGYSVILFLSGLNIIPQEVYDAAQIDGASKKYILQKITLPMLVPTTFFAFVMAIINSFKSYREAFLLSGLYPHDSIYFIQHFLNNNFKNYDFIKVSTAGIILFGALLLVLAVIFVIQNKYSEENLW